MGFKKKKKNGLEINVKIEDLGTLMTNEHLNTLLIAVNDAFKKHSAVKARRKKEV